ncbi:nucleoside/nucleotide kinase family protein [Polaromonas jejuensis]|uniref:Nucleoside/nucleotide kinase family protein n=1 Tax=Polaromonas jejuensis TaxID=457502 RepID=A0ABW0QBA0_9BURK|nr:nucleoside/nucleotide kinase family protein [Polaromonas jejuensis]
MPSTPIPTLPTVPEAFRQRLEAQLDAGGRRLLGLVGPPGAGKSTLAAALLQSLGPRAQIVPMDGFHLANVELQRRGLTHCKGAPETFDSAGYVALLRRLRQQRTGEVVYAPEFRRELEEPVAGAIGVQAQTALVITEGNYLLLDTGHWANVAPLLDEVWYVQTDDRVRLQSLVQRHEQFGRSPDAARAWVQATDEPNARLIEATKARAHAIFRWDA